MVARLTVGKKKYAAVEEQMQAVVERAEDLRLRLTEAIARDAAAFEAVMAAYKLPKETQAEQDERSRVIESSLRIAAQVPLEVAGMALEVLELNAQVVAYGNLNAASDGATGAALTRAGLVGAGYNVRTNLKLLQDRAVAQDLLSQLNNIEQRAQELEQQIRSNLIERGGLPLG
jgi:formiminotetrahydrofolate cyclodeaminase